MPVLRKTKPVVKKPTVVETGVLALQSIELPYQVKRSSQRRRSFGFVVSEAGAIVFTAPRWVRLEQMIEFAQRKESFIHKRLKELAQKRAVAAEKELHALDLEGKYCELGAEWYRKAARSLLVPEVALWAGRVGVTVAKIRITSGKTVWGSCNSNGEINLSWRLMLVPAELREYVVIHELCHRVHMNHGVRFWNLVGKHCPDWEEKRTRLNKLGGEIG